MCHFLVNVLGQIQGVCRINIPCLVIGTREYVTSYENSFGLTKQKWFDGEVDQNMIIVNRQRYFITEVDETMAPNDICGN